MSQDYRVTADDIRKDEQPAASSGADSAVEGAAVTSPNTDEFTTRDDMARLQAERLPQLAVQWLLNINPKRALDKAAADDALELAAAEVVESGREFDQLTDQERRSILTRNYEYTRERNLTFMRLLEDGRN